MNILKSTHNQRCSTKPTLAQIQPSVARISFPPNSENDCGPVSFLLIIRSYLKRLYSTSRSKYNEFKAAHASVFDIISNFNDSKWALGRTSLYAHLNSNVVVPVDTKDSTEEKHFYYNLGTPIAIFEKLPLHLLNGFACNNNDLLVSIVQLMKCPFCCSVQTGGRASLSLTTSINDITHHIQQQILCNTESCDLCRQQMYVHKTTNMPALLCITASPYTLATHVDPIDHMMLNIEIDVCEKKVKYMLCGVLYSKHTFNTGSCEIVGRHFVSEFMNGKCWVLYDGVNENKQFYDLKECGGPMFLANDAARDEVVMLVYEKVY